MVPSSSIYHCLVIDVLCCTEYRQRQKKCTANDKPDGDTASRLIGRAGKVGFLSGRNGLAISKRPSDPFKVYHR